jgi:Asp/Glu/hydantoin racemase
MSDVLKAAFIFVAPNADPASQRNWVRTEAVELLAVAVKDYDQAEAVARELVEKDGIKAIELCGGFGTAGTARIAAAVNVPVGVVRFDVHPGLGNVSGDTLFG